MQNFSQHLLCKSSIQHVLFHRPPIFAEKEDYFEKKIQEMICDRELPLGMFATVLYSRIKGRLENLFCLWSPRRHYETIVAGIASPRHQTPLGVPSP